MDKKYFRAVITAVILVLSLVPIMAVSIYTYPTADDFTYGLFVRRAVEQGGNIIDVIKAACATVAEYYRIWQGTFSATFIFALQPGGFSYDLYFLTTVLMVGALIASTMFTDYTVVVRWVKGTRTDAIIIGCAMLFFQIQFVPDKTQSFYWFNGSAYYTLFYSFSLLFYALLMPYLLFGIIVLMTEHLWLAPATPNIRDLTKTAEENILQYYQRMIFDYFDGLPRLPVKGAGYVFIAACLIGIVVKGFYRTNFHLTLLLIGTLVVTLNLPYTNGQRYLYNVLPLMIMYCLYGFQALWGAVCKFWKGAHGTVGKVIVIALAVEILFFSFANQVYRAGYNLSHRGGIESFSYDVYSDEAKEMYRFLQEELPEDSVIAFGKPRALYLNTGRTSFKVGVNGHEIGEADYYLKHRTMGFEDAEVEKDGMEIAAENDMFTLYKVVEGK